MASPQKENGYTPIANELLEALCSIEVGGACYRVMWVIIRKTYGYNKKQDGISLTQFEKITKMYRPTIIDALDTLEQMHIVNIDRSSYINQYGINKNYDEWTSNQNRTSSQNPTSRVLPTDSSQKHTKTSSQNPTYKRNKYNTKDISKTKVLNMGWNNKSDNDDDLPSIDLDSREPERDIEDERKKKVTALIEWAEKLRGKKFLDIPTQRKFINDMRTAGISPTDIKQKYQELLVSEYWQERTELPDFKTVFSNLKNKK